MSGGANIQILPHPEGVADAAAASFVELARTTARARGRFTVALAGGGTPRPLYERLARAYRDGVPWERVHVFWSDERYVPAEDSESNYRMARETLLDHVPIPRTNLHPFPTGLPTPDAAAYAYENLLRAFFGTPWPGFDLVLLGLGEDGHVGSLFPGSPALRERNRAVVSVEGPKPPRQRLTLTLPAINHSALVHFIVTGAGKAEAVRRALEGPRDLSASVAQGVHPVEGVRWWLDRAATRLLRRAHGGAGGAGDV